MTIEARRKPVAAERPNGDADRLTDPKSERDAESWRLFGKIVGSVSHDFRSHLNTLNLTLELLQRFVEIGPVPPERAREYHDRMAAEIPKLERMLRAIIEPVRPDDATEDRFDFRDVCAGAVVLCECYARSRRIRVRSALTEPLLWTLGERRAVWIAMISLLVNMIDALPEAAHLSLSLHAEQRLATFSAAAYAPDEAGRDSGSTPMNWSREPSAAAILSAREILARHDAKLIISEPQGPARLTVEMPLASRVS
jgi:signal transduction histidine kinase